MLAVLQSDGRLPARASGLPERLFDCDPIDRRQKQTRGRKLLLGEWEGTFILRLTADRE